eukprot:3054609-Pleurochrysis_carterae.AAC.2
MLCNGQPTGALADAGLPGPIREGSLPRGFPQPGMQSSHDPSPHAFAIAVVLASMPLSVPHPNRTSTHL